MLQSTHCHAWKEAALEEPENQSAHSKAGEVLDKAIAHAHQTPAELSSVSCGQAVEACDTHRDSRDDSIELQSLHVD